MNVAPEQLMGVVWRHGVMKTGIPGKIETGQAESVSNLAHGKG